MANAWAQLGDIRFPADPTVSALESKYEEVFAQQEVIDGKPRLQATGSALDTHTLTIDLDIGYGTGSPRAQRDALLAAQRARTPLPFVLGTGIVIGTFVITKIGVSTHRTTAAGELLSAQLTVELLEWVPNPNVAPSQPKGAAVKGASATPPATVKKKSKSKGNTAAKGVSMGAVTRHGGKG